MFSFLNVLTCVHTKRLKTSIFTSHLEWCALKQEMFFQRCWWRAEWKYTFGHISLQDAGRMVCFLIFLLLLSGARLLISDWAERESAHLNSFIFLGEIQGTWDRNRQREAETVSGENRASHSRLIWRMFVSLKALREDFRFLRDCPRLAGGVPDFFLAELIVGV